MELSDRPMVQKIEKKKKNNSKNVIETI